MQAPSAGSGNSLRKIKADAVAASIAETALALFDKKGFDGVTVDEIASASGHLAAKFLSLLRDERGHRGLGARRVRGENH